MFRPNSLPNVRFVAGEISVEVRPNLRYYPALIFPKCALKVSVQTTASRCLFAVIDVLLGLCFQCVRLPTYLINKLMNHV